MKRLLFSSLALLILSAFSCSGNSKASKASETQSVPSATRTDVQSTVKVVDVDSASPEHKSGSQVEEVHQHGVPNQNGLDSVKNSYPKKR
jgi:hypothetical protein